MALEDRVESALAEGSRSLAAVVERVVPPLAPAERYRATGRVAGLVAARVAVSGPLERRWTALEALDLVLEDWALEPWTGPGEGEP